MKPSKNLKEAQQMFDNLNERNQEKDSVTKAGGFADVRISKTRNPDMVPVLGAQVVGSKPARAAKRVKEERGLKGKK